MNLDLQIEHSAPKEFRGLYSYSYNGESICDHFENKDMLISLGLGMNNAPHIMTVYQLLNLLALQKKGCKIQIVLGDYDVLLARQFKVNNELIKKYSSFIRRMGFSEDTIIRTQRGDTDTMLSLPLISSVIEDSDFDSLSEPYDVLYNRHMSFKSKFSFVLMASDFITPIITEAVNIVCMAGGIDEAKYAVWSDILLQRILGENKGKHVCGMFTDIFIPGLKGHPKMSKSIPDSAIFVSDSEEIIKEKIYSIRDEETLRKMAELFGLRCNPTNTQAEIIKFILEISYIWNN